MTHSGETGLLATLASTSIGLLFATDHLSDGTPASLISQARQRECSLGSILVVQKLERLHNPLGGWDAVIAEADLDRSAEHLLRAIKAAAHNTTYRSPAVPNQRKADGAAQANTTLSSRDHELLHCFALGLSNREAASALGITEQTAKSYSSRLLTKLGVSNRTKAVSVARQMGVNLPF